MNLYRWLNKRHQDKVLKGIRKSIDEYEVGGLKTTRWEDFMSELDERQAKEDAQIWLRRAARKVRIYLFGWNGLINVRLRPRNLVNRTVWAWQRARRGWCDCDCWSIDHHITQVLAGMLAHLAEHNQAYPGQGQWDTPEKWEAHLRDLSTRMRAWENWDDDSATAYETTKAALLEFAQNLGYYWDLQVKQDTEHPVGIIMWSLMLTVSTASRRLWGRHNNQQETHMAKVITRLEELPPYAQENVARLKSFGLGWGLVEEHRLADASRRIQVRTIAQLAPPQETSKYEQDMRRGDQFPPVIVTSDGYLIDGHTRTEAARKIGWKTFPAIRLDVKAEGAPASVRNQLIAIGAAFNATHGRRMSAANFAEIIDTIAVEDDTPKEIARRLRIKESTANTLLNAAKAKQRANRLGVTLNGTLTNSHLKLLGGKTQQFTDPVFSALIQLTQDAHLTINATTDLAKRLMNTGTERERLNMISDEREGYRSVIEGGNANPTKAARLRQSLGFLNGQEDPDQLAELDPHAARVHMEALRDAALRLTLVMDAQERVERTRNAGE